VRDIDSIAAKALGRTINALGIIIPLGMQTQKTRSQVLEIALSVRTNKFDTRYCKRTNPVKD